MDGDNQTSTQPEEPLAVSVTDFTVSTVAGGVLPLVNPIFTKSKKYIIALTSLELRMYLLATKQCVKSFPIETKGVSDIYLDNDDKVWVARKTGLVSVVNLETKSVEQEFDLGVPVAKIIAKASDNRLVFISGLREGSKETLMTLSEATREGDDASWTVKDVAGAQDVRAFCVSNSGKYFAFCSGPKPETLTAGKLDDDYKLVGKKVTVKRSTPGTVASLAISNLGLLAYGSQSGPIELYHRFFEPGYGRESAPQVLKWHVDSVLSISFSLDNNYLLSGGKEKVLVFWQLETNRTQLLPRLNGEILAITLDHANELYALHLKNGELVVLSAVDLMSRLQIAGVSPAFNRLPPKRKPKIKEFNTYRIPDYTAPYYINPLTGHAYIPTGRSCNVQIYDTIRDELIATFAAAPAIQIGKVKGEAAILDPEVKHIAFSSDGKWMVTVDEYSPPKIDALLSSKDRQINLKFWKYSQASGTWALTTRVSSPHGTNKPIVEVIPADPSFHKGHAFLTVCAYGGVRLWRPETLKEIQTVKEAKNQPQGRQISWTIRKVLPPLASYSAGVSAAWSADNSVLILGFESTLYVIDAVKFEVQQVLPNILSSRVRWLKIAGNNLVVLSKTRLVVYDLVNSTYKWFVNHLSSQNGNRLVDIDPLTGTIALVANLGIGGTALYESRIFIFSSDSPIPIYTATYPKGISAIKRVPGTTSPTFSMLDMDARISTLETAAESSSSKGFKGPSQQLGMVDGFESAISSLYANSHQAAAAAAVPIDFDAANTQVNVSAFDHVFEDAELGFSSMEALFDRVMGVLSAPTKS